MVVILVLIDQLIKWAIVNYKPNFSIIGNFLRIEYIENTGTIFGLFEGSNLIFIIFSSIICIIIALYMQKNVPKKSFKEKCFMLILAGGLGNLIDRIFRSFVVDYVSLKWIGIFNLSDACIVIGIVLVFILTMEEYLNEGKSDKKSFFNK